MTAFLEWFTGDDGTDLVLRACIANLWFVTIHPFEDGNGRIARAIADMTLARSEQSIQRFTACQLSSGGSGRPITRDWKLHKKARSISQNVWNGSSIA